MTIRFNQSIDQSNLSNVPFFGSLEQQLPHLSYTLSTFPLFPPPPPSFRRRAFVPPVHLVFCSGHSFGATPLPPDRYSSLQLIPPYSNHEGYVRVYRIVTPDSLTLGYLALILVGGFGTRLRPLVS